MKFVHMADMHFDAPFATLAKKENKAIERRIEQRKVMREIVEYIKENSIPYFFIAGDLYENQYIRLSTIEFINNLFKEIPKTKVLITPGNHDPYIKNSYYKQFKWNDNVIIFSNEIQKINYGNVEIYGYGFNDFYMKTKQDELNIEDNSKINILITHGSLDNIGDENKEYNPLNSKILNKIGFDYVALGHIHKISYCDYDKQKIVYPGSPVSLGFDELGKRGFIVGEIEENTKKLELKFVETTAKTFEELNLDISLINSEEELIEKIINLNLDENKYYKIKLIGKRNFELIEKNILELTNRDNILKIKNLTQEKYNIKEIAKELSLKGIFANEILEKINITEDINEKKDLLKAFEIGMDAFYK